MGPISRRVSAHADGLDFKIISRLDGVPAIHDSVAYAQYAPASRERRSRLTRLKRSHSVDADYIFALQRCRRHRCSWVLASAQRQMLIVTGSYDVATPILKRGKPLLESADGLAVAT